MVAAGHIASLPMEFLGSLSEAGLRNSNFFEAISLHRLRMKRGLLSLQIADQFLGPVNRDLIAYRALDSTVALNRFLDLYALITHGQFRIRALGSPIAATFIRRRSGSFVHLLDRPRTFSRVSRCPHCRQFIGLLFRFQTMSIGHDHANIALRTARAVQPSPNAARLDSHRAAQTHSPPTKNTSGG
jgi:hypothetical protein